MREVRNALLGSNHVRAAIMISHPALRFKLLREIMSFRIAIDLVRIVNDEGAFWNNEPIDDCIFERLTGKSQSNRGPEATRFHSKGFNVFDCVRVKRVRDIVTVDILDSRNGSLLHIR
jgi:hypothetical protein